MAGSGNVVLLALAAASGLTFPPVGPAMRAAWRVVLRDNVSRRAGYALDASAVEAVFVGGPLVLSLLLVVSPPVVPLLVTAGLLAAGGVAGPEHRRLPVTLTTFAAALGPIPILVEAGHAPLVLLLPLLFVAGLSIAPSLIMAQNMLDELAPAHRVNEAQSLLTAAATSGAAAGTAAAGALVDLAIRGSWWCDPRLVVDELLDHLVSASSDCPPNDRSMPLRSVHRLFHSAHHLPSVETRFPKPHHQEL